MLRYFGARGLQDLLRAHIALAQELAGWIEAEPQWEVLAPHPFSVICFRFAPAGRTEEEVGRLNAILMDAANAGGELFISHTKIDGRFALRMAIGNLRTTRAHVRRAWEILNERARDLPGARTGGGG